MLRPLYICFDDFRRPLYWYDDNDAAICLNNSVGNSLAVQIQRSLIISIATDDTDKLLLPNVSER